MKTLRVIAAAFMVFLGAILVVAWAVAGRAVEAIDSGTAASNITEKLLAEPALADGVASRLQSELDERVADTPLRFLTAAFSQEIHDALVSVITSDRVTNAITTTVGRVEEQITAEVTDPDRAPGPFVITIDPSERINARIDEIPVVGFLIPAVEVEPVTVELIEAETFEDVRAIYKLLNTVATWAIWVALVLIVAGFWVAPRSRWYWARALVGAGLIVLAVSFAIGRIVPASLADAVPGGANGGAGEFLSEFVSENTIAPMVRVLLGWAAVALVFAVIFAVVARFLPSRAERDAKAAAAEVAASDAVVAESGAAHEATPNVLFAEPALAGAAVAGAHASSTATPGADWTHAGSVAPTGHIAAPVAATELAETPAETSTSGGDVTVIPADVDATPRDEAGVDAAAVDRAPTGVATSTAPGENTDAAEAEPEPVPVPPVARKSPRPTSSTTSTAATNAAKKATPTKPAPATAPESSSAESAAKPSAAKPAASKPASAKPAPKKPAPKKPAAPKPPEPPTE